MPAISVADAELLAARILLVDDQAANLHLLEQMLGATGYTCVRSTSRPQHVLDLHREHDFDLIVLDLQMPGMDGFEVMEQLRTLDRDPYLPVLVLTAQPSQKLRALQAGARDFVGKPFDMLELQTRIRNMVEVRLLHRRLAAYNVHLEQAVLDRTAELRESEARFQRLVELATDWYWEQDAEGKFTRVSGPALEMLGVTGEDAGAGAWVADAQAALGAKLASRAPFLDFVYRRVLPDGSEQVLQASGEPSFDEAGRFRGYRGIGTDVTSREGKGGESVDALRRFRAALEDAGAAIVLRDASSLRIVDANRAACRLAGKDREQLLAAPVGELEAGGADALRDSVERLRASGRAERADVGVASAGQHPRWRSLQPGSQGELLVDIHILPAAAG